MDPRGRSRSAERTGIGACICCWTPTGTARTVPRCGAAVGTRAWVNAEVIRRLAEGGDPVLQALRDQAAVLVPVRAARRGPTRLLLAAPDRLTALSREPP